MTFFRLDRTKGAMKMMMTADTIATDLAAIRRSAPLVHNITNYVVMNSTANALLALGASPVMAHAVEEVEQMVHIAAALVINIGTLSEKWIDAMMLAVRTARERGIPVILDPVGAGATDLRTRTARQLIEAAPPAIIRGNASEILAMQSAGTGTKGVDATDSADTALEAGQALHAATGSVVCISGETDYIVGGEATIRIANGHPMMPRVTGLGCTATALCGAFAAVNADARMAAAHAMAVMGIAGEMAAVSAAGPGSLQTAFIDALYGIGAADIRQRLITE